MSFSPSGDNFRAQTQAGTEGQVSGVTSPLNIWQIIHSWLTDIRAEPPPSLFSKDNPCPSSASQLRSSSSSSSSSLSCLLWNLFEDLHFIDLPLLDID